MHVCSTGIHVRFRLGGASFPPALYYKVFLLNALCDVGSFAPRDYAKKSAFPSTITTAAHAEPSSATLGQIRVGGSYFGTQVHDLGPEGTSKWYKRVENNGWRPVTHRAASEAAYVTSSSSSSSSSVGPKHGGPRARKGSAAAAVVPPHGAIPPEELASLSKENRGTAFHYSRVKRAEDKAAAHKAKKRAWLQHMYRDGLARERGDGDDGGNRNDEGDNGANPAVGNRSKEDAHAAVPVASQGMPSQTNTKGGGELFDSTFFDDDDLGVENLADMLAWSAELDYESYVANWHVLATSAASGHTYHAAGNGTAAARSRRAVAINGGGRAVLPEPDWIALNEQFQADL